MTTQSLTMFALGIAIASAVFNAYNSSKADASIAKLKAEMFTRDSIYTVEFDNLFISVDSLIRYNEANPKNLSYSHKR